MNELYLDKRSSFQDCEDTTMINNEEVIDDVMVSD